MEKIVEFFDAWVKSQKEFIENWVKSQKEFMEHWTEATKKMQESFTSMGGPQEGPAKEMINLCNSWVTTMINASKSFSDEAARMQETWKNAFEKQLEMSREMVKNFTELFKQKAAK